MIAEKPSISLFAIVSLCLCLTPVLAVVQAACTTGCGGLSTICHGDDDEDCVSRICWGCTTGHATLYSDVDILLQVPDNKATEFNPVVCTTLYQCEKGPDINNNTCQDSLFSTFCAPGFTGFTCNYCQLSNEQPQTAGQCYVVDCPE